MYDIPQEDIERYLKSTAKRDLRANNSSRIGAFEHRPMQFWESPIDMKYKPDNMEYGDVEYWNESRQAVMYENIERHKDNGWSYVHKCRHKELPTVSDDTKRRFQDNRSPSRGLSQMYEFDTDDELIKRNGLVLMEKDADAQREYENRIHAPVIAHSMKTTEKGFNSEANQFGMRMQIQADSDMTSFAQSTYY